MSAYDKKKVGQRIRAQREALGLTREQLAEKIGRVPRFCADVERGKVGMSIETMLGICDYLKISPNEMLFGGNPFNGSSRETEMIMVSLNQCTEKQRKDALALLKLFLTAIQ